MPPRLLNGFICKRCLLQKRQFSATPRQAQLDLPPVPPRAGHVRLSNRALISLSGVDSTDFLQGLITQNLAPKNRSLPTAAFYAGFLNSQGRVLHDVFIYRSPEGQSNDPSEAEYLIEVDREQVPNLLKHLKKHKLRAKLKFRALDEGERSVWALWDDQEKPNRIIKDTPEGGSVLSCVDYRAPGLGLRLIAGESKGAEELFPGEEVSLPTYSLRRILHGVPEGQNELVRESGLPMDSNMDAMGGIDFHKGCYVGQELTIRTHHRGVVRKRILPYQIYDASASQPDSDGPVYSPDSALSLPPTGANITKARATGKGRSAGKFLTGIGNVGLALCRLETMTDVVLTGESSQYNADEEFRISWDADADAGRPDGGEVKVKAFVPPWLREYISHGGARQRAPTGEVQRARDMVEELEEEKRTAP